MSKAPVVAILCPKAWGVRNMVHAGVCALLQARGVRPVLFLPGYSGGPGADLPADLERRELKNPERVRRGLGLAFRDNLLHASFTRRYGLNYRPMAARWRMRRMGITRRLKQSVVELLSVAGSRYPFFEWQWRSLDRSYRSVRDLTPVREQLAELNPSLVVSTNCQFSEEKPYVFAAADLSISTLAFVQSFDNLTTRNKMPVFDSYGLWNERMKQQLLRLYPDRHPDRVWITGTPQFDFHVNPEWRWTREVTLQRLGLDTGDSYVVYAPSGGEWEPAMLSQLDRRMGESEVLRRHRVVVRPHPVDDMERWKPLMVPGGRFVLTPPWAILEGEPWDSPNVVVPDHQKLLVSTLLHADVCVNMASTISLDAAAVDTPVICTGFAGTGEPAEDAHSYELHFSDHYRPIVESAGVRLVLDMDALVAELEAYVIDPSRDAAGRAALVVSECGPVDGAAAGRVADLIARLSGVDLAAAPDDSGQTGAIVGGASG